MPCRNDMIRTQMICLFRYGHISWTLGNRVFIAGGLLPSQKRPISVTCLNQELNSIIWIKDLLKMNNSVFSACDVINDFCYIFGGRGSPYDPSDNFMKIDCDGNTLDTSQVPWTMDWRKNGQNTLFWSFPTFLLHDWSYDFVLKVSRLIFQWETKVTLGIFYAKPYFKHFI